MPAAPSVTSGAPIERKAIPTMSAMRAMLANSMIGRASSIALNCASRAGPAPVTPTTAKRRPPSSRLAKRCAAWLWVSRLEEGSK